jgi:membrane-bound inhibitor of C-type lysozyme
MESAVIVTTPFSIEVNLWIRSTAIVEIGIKYICNEQTTTAYIKRAINHQTTSLASPVFSIRCFGRANKEVRSGAKYVARTMVANNATNEYATTNFFK